MRFMLLQNYGGVEVGLRAHDRVGARGDRGPHPVPTGAEPGARRPGELVDAQGLAGPDQAKFVVSDGAGAPVITDGPFPESKELLAGYRLVDVETAERASRSPPRPRPRPAEQGQPIRQRIEVRQVMSRPRP